MKIQVDLDSLVKRSEDNILFNRTKSFFMNFELNSSPVPPTSYNIDDHLLDVQGSCHDLGVTITHNLSWSDHIASKAYRILGLPLCVCSMVHGHKFTNYRNLPKFLPPQYIASMTIYGMTLQPPSVKYYSL